MSGVSNPQSWLTESVGGGVSSSGATVNVNTSLGVPAVWSGVSLIAGHVAELEICIKRRSGEDRMEAVRSHPAYRLLNKEPNAHQIPVVFRETLMCHALLQGNGRAWIRRNGVGQPVELIPLLPWDTYVAIIDGEKWHVTYVHPDYPSVGGGDGNGNIRTIHDDDVFHIPGLSYNGFWGVHLLQIARDVLGLSISGQTYTGATFKNNGRPGIILEAPQGELRTAQKRREFLDEFNRSFQGAQNSGKALILLDGMKAHTVAMKAADAELTSLREMSSRDIDRLLLLPEQGNNAYKTITERQMLYNTNTLARWLRKWEQEVYRKLLSEREKMSGLYEVQVDTSPLIRGDPNSWAEYTGKLRQQGIINGNEGRQMHGFNPVADEMLEHYGNPNISTVPAAEPEQPEEEEEEPEAEPMEARAIRRVIDPLIAYERRRVTRAARRDGNFLSWAEDFYSTFENQLTDACADLHLPPQLAEDYCNKSLGDLLELTGIVSQDGLSDAVSELTDVWKSRAGEFADVRV